MGNYNIAICDDEDYYLEEMKKFISTYANETEQNIRTFAFYSTEALLEKAGEGIIDIFILDVEINGVSGVQLARAIRQIDKDVPIIFATSFECYALAAYDVEAVGYLLKPVSYVKLKSFMNKAIMNVEFLRDLDAAQNKYMEIKVRSDKIMIETSRILYIEKRRNNSIIHTMEKEYTCSETLVQLMNRLNPHQFVYSHQGYIINFIQVKEVTRTSVFVAQHIEVPLSRKHYKEISERFINRLNKVRMEKKKELKV